jgi:hypothetical protein
VHQFEESNPFAPIRAADYTDAQINNLWVELGAAKIASILEPRSAVSKYILGSKGSGKTHLLRYHSYQVARLRTPKKPGMAIVENCGCLAVFLRTTNMDAGRFDLPGGHVAAWQQLFSIHLELRLADLVIDALRDISSTEPNATFNDKHLLGHLGKTISDESFTRLTTISHLQEWISKWLRTIDDSINAAAFTGKIDLRLPFSIGGLCLPLGASLRSWSLAFSDFNLIYILDEIENLSEQQQEVINTLVRYAEARAAFRITGRLYARKTLATIAGGEENREGSEFKVTRLDDILRATKKYSEFAQLFLAKRMGIPSPRQHKKNIIGRFDPRSIFEELDFDAYINRFLTPANDARFVRAFRDAMSRSRDPAVQSSQVASEIIEILTADVPPILQRLNVLLFCKKFKSANKANVVAGKIREECFSYIQRGGVSRSSYATAVGHWKWDLFAQLCRESKRRDAVVPYAGFETFVTMSAHNPRNLLVLWGKVYEVASFKEFDMTTGAKLPVDIQTEAASEAARFAFDGDSNYGHRSDQARDATSRLAEVLRTARYALNIPEVSPLAVSFHTDELSQAGRQTLESALNYSLLIEISEGRPDRNNQRILKKIQLNPMLSARWGLPIGRRGDLSLSAEMVHAIFDPTAKDEFEVLLRQASAKWNFPFSPHPKNLRQENLF